MNRRRFLKITAGLFSAPVAFVISSASIPRSPGAIAADLTRVKCKIAEARLDSILFGADKGIGDQSAIVKMAQCAADTRNSVGWQVIYDQKAGKIKTRVITAREFYRDGPA